VSERHAAVLVAYKRACAAAEAAYDARVAAAYDARVAARDAARAASEAAYEAEATAHAVLATTNTTGATK